MKKRQEDEEKEKQ